MLVNSSHFGPILKLLEGEFSTIIGLNSTNFIPRLWIFSRSDKVLYLTFPILFVRAKKLLDDYLSFRFSPKEAYLGLSIVVIDYKKLVSSSSLDGGCELAAAANIDIDEVSSSLRTMEDWPAVRFMRCPSDSIVSARLFRDY
jgi:hypothetical protein